MSRASTSGSSPLTRGKRGGLCAHLLLVRLIPAHAGKTGPCRGCRRGGAAHPRSRGENDWRTPPARYARGSSPLTRGKHSEAIRTYETPRLIPAHAGKTPCRARSAGHPEAHPRSRGENGIPTARVLQPGGSSPLTRGKHFLTCAFIAQIDQILESLELCASSESYSLRDAYATDVLQDQVRSIGLAPLSSRGAS